MSDILGGVEDAEGEAGKEIARAQQTSNWT